MTGKELAIILAGATAVGGTAGVAAVAVSSREPAPPVAPTIDTADLEDRLERLERELGATTAERDELRVSLESLRDRLERAEASVDAGTVSQPRETVLEGGEFVDVDGTVTGDGSTVRIEGAEDLDGALRQGLKVALERLDGDGGDVGALIASTSVPALEDVKIRLEGLRNSIALRQISEDERWQKARDELGLTPYQENELRGAIAERDRLMEDAMVVDKREDDGRLGTYEVRRLDPTLAKEANKAYRNRVGNALTEEQAKDWNRKGYANAMGKSPYGGMGGTSVMTIKTTTTSTTDETGVSGQDDSR